MDNSDCSHSNSNSYSNDSYSNSVRMSDTKQLTPNKNRVKYSLVK